MVNNLKIQTLSITESLFDKNSLNYLRENLRKAEIEILLSVF